MNWLKKWRHRRILSRAPIDESLWQRVLGTLPFIRDLDAEEMQRLRDTAVLFLHAKQIHGAADLELNDDIRLSIALQACLPILNLDLSFYAGWVGVIVYPGGFRVNRSEMDEHGIVHEWKDELAGETWAGGPVVLSWEDIETGNQDARTPYNVVIHEFAHKLDMLHKDDATGFPLPHGGMDAPIWVDTLESAYAKFCRAVARGEEKYGDNDAFAPLDLRGEPLPFDAYAAEDPAEFFAVMSEAFFVTPLGLDAAFGRLYRQLCLFYRQDPLARVHRKAAS